LEYFICHLYDESEQLKRRQWHFREDDLLEAESSYSEQCVAWGAQFSLAGLNCRDCQANWVTELIDLEKRKQQAENLKKLTSGTRKNIKIE
jgi:hypothetical protein